jgi:hypothetical protein
MTRASEAYNRLALAMTETDPACKDDDRYISDDVPAAVVAPLCNVCPVLEQCRAYAQIEKPKGGIWAGTRYGAKERKETKP